MFHFCLYYFFQEEFTIRCREFQQENEFEAILQGVEETRGEEVIKKQLRIFKPLSHEMKFKILNYT
jgi:hypothetical protein